MTIQWYPGHMHKARKQIEEVMPTIDLIIEVLDARIPFSSSNPMIAEMRNQKPCLKLLNKIDLADPAITEAWLSHFNKEKNIKAIAFNAQDRSFINRIPDLCREIVPHRNEDNKNLRTMVMGIPNVGKSTLINSLAGRVVAKTGNEPAVTKSQQRINLKNGIVLSDTPGILWPKVENENSSYRLALTGAIRDTAMDYEDVALFAVNYLKEHYPSELKERYKLESVIEEDILLLEAIGKNRGAVKSGHRVNYHKVSELLLHEIRSGKLGLLSFETPEMIEIEEKITQEKIESKKVADQQRKELYKTRKSKRHGK